MNLEQLIATDTQNPGTDYKKMILLLQSELKKQGANVKTVGKNVIGIWGKPKLLINAHLDTVKAIGWGKSNPLKAKVSKSKTIGLGACDNKGNIWCMLEAVSKTKPKNLMVLFSVDEEFGKISKINDFIKSGYSKGIKKVIVMEPTENKIITKHPGYYSFWLTFSAKQGHTSAVKENAIRMAAEAIVKLKKFNIGSIESTNISGNVSAGQCRIKISIRTFENHKKIIKKIKKLAPDAEMESSFVGLPFTNSKPFVNVNGKNKKNKVPFWSEAAVFSNAKFNTILYGAGSIKQAHTPGEFIMHSSLKKCIKFLQFAIGEYS